MKPDLTLNAADQSTNHVRLGRIDTRRTKQAAESIRCGKGRQEDKADS
jgi:hypothetical protein